MAVSTPDIYQHVQGDNNIIVGSGNVFVTNPAPLSDAERETRRGLGILLQRVRAFWIEGVLEKSIEESQAIEVGLELREQALDRRRAAPVETSARPASNSLDGLPWIDIYERAGGMLLILGDPGSGKTISLLRLTRELIERAEHALDFDRPVPVVFNLSSWKSGLSVLDWMARELAAQYSIPRAAGRAWLAQYRLLPMLDGLDETPPELRAACCQAINDYVTTTGLSGLVVCSRSAEYAAAGVKLMLNLAANLRPLAWPQVNAYLSTQGEPFSALRTAIGQDPVLMELACSPLNLSIMRLAYAGASPSDLAPGTPLTNEAWRTRLFSAYIERVLNRKQPGETVFPAHQVVYWLSGLARKMKQHGQSIFLIEQLQPSWLETRGQRWLYIMLSRVLASMAFFGFTFMLGLFYGPIIGVIDGLVFERRSASGERRPPTLGSRLLYIGMILLVFLTLYLLTNAVIAGGFYLLSLGPHSTPAEFQNFQENIIYRAVTGIPISLLPALIIGIYGSDHSLSADVRTVENLKWSWQKALKGSLLVGLFFSVAGTLVVDILAIVGQMDLISFVIVSAASILLYFFYFGIFVFPFAGLTSHVASGKILPNQGIKMSIRNAFRTGIWLSLAVSLAIGLVMVVVISLVVVVEVVIGALPGTANVIVIAVFTCIFMFILTVVFSLFAFGPPTACWYGGFDAIYHYVLRFRLQRSGVIPPQFERFLDYAVERILLRRVGGGFIFVHRLLLEHFAALPSRKPAP